MDLTPFLDALIDIAKAAVAAGTPVVIGYLVAWLRRKLKVEVSEDQQRTLQRAIEGGVNYAEQLARKRLREAGGLRMVGRDKLNAARAHAMKLGAGKVVPTVEQLEDLIEAEVGKRNSLLPPPPPGDIN